MLPKAEVVAAVTVTWPTPTSRELIEATSDGALVSDAARWGVLQPGTPTEKGPALFPRIERPDAEA